MCFGHSKFLFATVAVINLRVKSDEVKVFRLIFFFFFDVSHMRKEVFPQKPPCLAFRHVYVFGQMLMSLSALQHFYMCPHLKYAAMVNVFLALCMHPYEGNAERGGDFLFAAPVAASAAADVKCQVSDS